MKERYSARPSMASVFIDMPTVIFMKASGRMISSKGVGFSNLQTGQSMKESSIKVNPKARAFIIISQSNTMTSNNTVDHGKLPNRMGLARQFITMETSMKDHS